MSILGSVGGKIFNTVRYGSNFWTAPGLLPKTSWICNIVRPIMTTPALLAEPMKRKKRVDPQVQKRREDRKQRKLEKSIRRLQKHARQLKPLEELQIPTVITDNPRQRRRRVPQMSSEEFEERWLLEREMTQVRFQQVSRELRVIDTMLRCQEIALNELKNESEDLYLSALEFDSSYMPYKTIGPVDTPPIKGYKVPEGDYFDISKTWEPPV